MEAVKKVILANRFETLSLGKIKPAGWLKEQLIIQAEGMSGQLEENWEDVGSNSAWIGGTGEGWERGPYYLDGLLPLAYLLENEKLIKKAQKWIEWILSSQREDGWFGPTSDSDWWSRMIVGKVLIQYFEATSDDRVLPFLLNYARYQLQNLPNRPLYEWGRYRGGENVLVLIWLYEKSNESFILELIDIINEQTMDWGKLYKNYPFKRYVTEFDHGSHVVNVAMSLKYFGLKYQLTGINSYHEDLIEALNILTTYHGQLHGMTSGDEWLAGTHPSQGTELCSIVEYMFSMETLMKIFGENEFADRLERAAFNSLPAAISRDWLSHQYDQQVNQICCSDDKRNWTENGNDANMFGLEPHFGCCTANMHQGWPKFVEHLWMKEGDKLVCQSLVPCIVEDGEVTIEVQSEYPFRHKMLLKVSSIQSIDIKIRIPSWVTDVKLKKNGVIKRNHIENDFLYIQNSMGTEEYELYFKAEVVKEFRSQNAIGITFGPLIFALPIEEKWNKKSGEAPFFNWEIFPKSNWRYALSTKENYRIIFNEISQKQVFDSRHSPIVLCTSGWQVKNWQVVKNSAGTPPYRVEKGSIEKIILVPYGGAKLRIAEFPTIDERP